ncbi:MAG: zinc ribbon domain-containing protein [Candidatus Hodarchaeales archaeon]|jgi:hypothetical protein
MVTLSKILKILIMTVVICGVTTLAGFFLMFTLLPYSSTSSSSVVNPPDLQLSKTKRFQPNYTYEIRFKAYILSDHSEISINASFSISSDIHTIYSRTLTDNTSEYVTKIFEDWDPEYGSSTYEKDVWEVVVEDTIYIENLTSSNMYETKIQINSFYTSDGAPACSLLIHSNPSNGGALSGVGLIIFMITVVSFLGLFFSIPMLFILGFAKLFRSSTQQILPMYATSIKCLTCGAELVETDAFCPTCGRPPSIKRPFWTLKKGIFLFFGVWMVSAIISSLLFFPEVSGIIDDPTISGLPSDRTERTLVIVFLLFLVGLASSFLYVMIPFTVIIAIIWRIFLSQKQRSYGGE